MDVSVSLSLTGIGTGSLTVPQLVVYQPTSGPHPLWIKLVKLGCPDAPDDRQYHFEWWRTTAAGVTPGHTLTLTDQYGNTPGFILDYGGWGTVPALVTYNTTVRPPMGHTFNDRTGDVYYDSFGFLKIPPVVNVGLALMLINATASTDIDVTLGIHQD
jgi:hypothetical protein